jgi:hypothetical protein
MEKFFFLIIYFLSITSLGYSILSIIYKQKKISLLELTSLTILLGCGAMSILLFWLALINFPPSRPIIFIIFAISSTILLHLRSKKELPIIEKGKPWSLSEKVVASAAFLIFLFLFAIIYIHAMELPLYDIDAFALWGLKAKAIYHEGLIKDGLFFQLPLSYSHLNYPLLVPFLISGVYASIGEVNDIIGKVIFPFLFLGGSMFIYIALRWKNSRIWSIILTLMFISMPPISRWNSAGIADVPLTIFYACSIFYLVKYLLNSEKQDFILAILMTIFCAFIKNEGIAIAGINIAVFAIFNTFPFSIKKLKISAIFIFCVIILLLPWFLWSKSIPHTHENYPLRLQYFFSPTNLERIKEIIALFSANFANIYRWGFLWYLAILSGILQITKIIISKFSSHNLANKLTLKNLLPTIYNHKNKYIIAMWALLILQIAAYIFVFIISPWTPKFLAEMALERILLHAAPAALFIISFQLSDLRL